MGVRTVGYAVSMVALAVLLLGATADEELVEPPEIADEELPAAKPSGLGLRWFGRTRAIPSTDFGTADASAVSPEGGVRVTVPVSERLGFRVDLRGGATLYDFDDSVDLFGPLLSGDPFDELYQVRLRAGGQLRLSDHWALLAGGGLTSSWEDGADAGDGIRGGGFAAVVYERSDWLRVILGASVNTRLDRSGVGVSPVVRLRLGITDWLHLDADRNSGELVARLCDDLDLSVGGIFQSYRYRLDDRPMLVGGEGTLRDRQARVGAGLAWKLHEHWRVRLESGAVVYHKLKVQDEHRDTLGSLSGDPAPYVGLRIDLRL